VNHQIQTTIIYIFQKSYFDHDLVFDMQYLNIIIFFMWKRFEIQKPVTVSQCKRGFNSMGGGSKFALFHRN